MGPADDQVIVPQGIRQPHANHIAAYARAHDLSQGLVVEG
jgi:hypothetical protein